MDPVDKYLNNKKYTYWKVWEVKEGGWAWVLFFTDALTGAYHTGTDISEEGCMKEIRWVIGTHIDKVWGGDDIIDIWAMAEALKLSPVVPT